MADPRVIFETDLHNDCGLIAAAAFRYLTSHGVKARVLNIRYGKEDGHTIVIYENAGRIVTYDHDGSLIYEKGTTWDTKPLLLARSWAKANCVGRKVIDASWL